jgi:cytochrome c553
VILAKVQPGATVRGFPDSILASECVRCNPASNGHPFMKTVLLVFAILIAITVPLLAGGASNAAQESSDALQSRPDLDRGAALFHMCAACHGTSGAGTPDGEIPRIAGQHFSVLVKQLVDYRSDRRWDPRMEHFADQHHLKNAREIADVAAYTSQIETAPEAEVGVGSGEFLARGSEIYARSCVSCHGMNGNGSGRQQVPRLAGQNYTYLLRQIHDAVEGRRPNFSASHIRLLKELDYSGISGVADYLARIPRRIDRMAPQDLAAN